VTGASVTFSYDHMYMILAQPIPLRAPHIPT